MINLGRNKAKREKKKQELIEDTELLKECLNYVSYANKDMREAYNDFQCARYLKFDIDEELEKKLKERLDIK